MKKALLTALLLVPFFSLSVIADIFTNMTGQSTSPQDCKLYTYAGGYESCGENDGIAIQSALSSPGKGGYLNCFVSAHIDTSKASGKANIGCEISVSDGYGGTVMQPVSTGTTYSFKDVVVDACPTGASYKHTNGQCYDPTEIILHDSCNMNDIYNVVATEQVACMGKADGSRCGVKLTNLGTGTNPEHAYVGAEHDCYKGKDDYPDVTNAEPKGDLPVDENCVNNGGLLACPEDPANVCESSGSSFGGGGIQNCMSGCGFVQDAFVCYDQDSDGDGLPDYNDPDIDGDGIANDLDLDSDGDGKDDALLGGKCNPATESCVGNNSGSGSGNGQPSEIDLSPVVSEIKKTNTKLDSLLDQFKTDTQADAFGSDGKLDEHNTKYQTDINNLLSNNASSMGYTNTLILGNSTGLTTNIPTQQCKNYSIPVGMFGNFTIDTCELATKVQPLLTWFFGLLTAWYVFFTVNQTLREGV